MRVLIITGGTLDLGFAKKFLEKQTFDFILAADKGVDYGNQLNCKIDLILGDFDSVNLSILEEYEKSKTKIYPPEKDYTDTHLALLTAIEQGATDITILGGTGSRWDHTMANIGLLKIPYERHIPCRIVDPNNRIQMLCNDTEIKKQHQWGNYISLIPFTEQVSGVTLSGFKFPLNDATLTQGESVGISNELMSEYGSISYTTGILLMIEAND